MIENDLINIGKDQKIEKKVNRLRERELSDIRFILKSPEGRRVYLRFLEAGRVFHDPFCNENTNGTNYNLGRQSISRDFLNDILEASPKGYEQMMNEKRADEEDQKRQEIREQQSGGVI